MKRIIIITAFVVLFAVALLMIKTNQTKNGLLISVGIIAPLTGNRADAGVYMQNALTLFQEKEKKQAAKYDFILEDDRYSNDNAVMAVHNLLDAKGVRYLIGPYGTPQVLAVAPITEAALTVVLIPGAQADTITDAGEYLFRLIHNAKQEAPVFGTFVSKQMKSEIIYFLAIKNDFAVSYLKNIKLVFEASDKKVVLVDEFLPTDTDFKTQLLKVKALNPTDIFAIATPKQMGLIAKQARELEINAQFYNIGVESPDLIAAGSDAVEELYYPYSYDPVSTPEAKSFATEYRARFGQEPDAVAANTYDALFLLDHCITNVGDNTELVKNCLYSIKDFRGVSGTFSIDAKGDVEKPIIIKQIRGGKFVKVSN